MFLLNKYDPLFNCVWPLEMFSAVAHVTYIVYAEAFNVCGLWPLLAPFAVLKCPFQPGGLFRNAANFECLNFSLNGNEVPLSCSDPPEVNMVAAGPEVLFSPRFTRKLTQDPRRCIPHFPGIQSRNHMHQRETTSHTLPLVIFRCWDGKVRTESPRVVSWRNAQRVHACI